MNRAVEEERVWDGIVEKEEAKKKRDSGNDPKSLNWPKSSLILIVCLTLFYPVRWPVLFIYLFKFFCANYQIRTYEVARETAMGGREGQLFPW